ncbi:MAG: VOC family protein [Acidimicrobiales bacterium]|jgi:catechol-2,3-dioxygenase
MTIKLGLELAHSVVYVKDMAAIVSFYERVLGFEVSDRGPIGPPEGPEIVFMSQHASHHHQIAFLSIREETGRSNSHDHLAFKSSATLAELRELLDELEAEEGVTNIRQTSHGNAWSIYFADPEGNGVEVFLDTPFHVPQPQRKTYDLRSSDADVLQWTIDNFGDEQDFRPMAEYQERREAELAERQS